ncbi:hypothetical protein M413DRAFT_438922 [Hebeloma cylindrosporum]|uniref:N-acetyltransferase domain-containing protein n=1 Tax=Hebeloma cylindrosporum TaxID=76867 RepID=A0A0C3CM78_HEBCY|nr:hypothetical protein M413DRAFT_438922 [Hebeloma cylindrosporum h7]
MSNPRYLEKNFPLDSNTHPQNGVNSKKHIHVRLLKDSDQAHVRELFESSMTTGDASPFESAMKAQRRSPAAFLSYFLTIFGTFMATRSRQPIATFGYSILAFTGCITFFLYRRYLKASFIGFLKQSFEGDLANIPKHYKLMRHSGESDDEKLRATDKSCFWVAELDEGGSEPTIVGCIGLGASYYDTH